MYPEMYLDGGEVGVLVRVPRETRPSDRPRAGNLALYAPPQPSEHHGPYPALARAIARAATAAPYTAFYAAPTSAG